MTEFKSAQCILHNDKDNTFYCFFNKKHNKFAPVGGKREDTDTCGIDNLLREVNEEISIGNIKKIRELGLHILLERSKNAKYLVETYVMFVSDISAPKEDFLELVKLKDIPKEKLNMKYSYTSLLSIIDSINDGYVWRCDSAIL